MNRDEHLAWAKRRALEYLERHDLEQGYTSMASDLAKHPELKRIEEKMSPIGLHYLINRDATQLRRWIEGFH